MQFMIYIDKRYHFLQPTFGDKRLAIEETIIILLPNTRGFWMKERVLKVKKLVTALTL